MTNDACECLCLDCRDGKHAACLDDCRPSLEARMKDGTYLAVAILVLIVLLVSGLIFGMWEWSLATIGAPRDYSFPCRGCLTSTVECSGQ